MVDLSSIEQIEDESALNKMLNEATEFDERRAIRKRLLELKELKSKQRAKEMEEREKRMQNEIEERKQRKEDEKKQEMQRLEELGKTSTADRIENEAGKKRQDFIKEKYQAAEEEKKKNMENFEKMAKENKNEESEKNSKTNAPTSLSSSKIQKPTMNSAQSKNSSASAFALFQNKDKEAGGTGKGTMTQTAPASPNSPQAIKDNLLKWCQQRTEGYPNVNIQNFSSSWADGMAFCALIHSAVPETFDFSKLNPKNRKGNFNLAFKVAEDKCDISPLLEVEDMLMMGNKPDWKCVFTYVQSIYRKLELEPKARAAKNNEN